MAYLLRAEVEYFLALLSERLDIAKARALLSVSLNCALLLRRDALYLHYEGAGRQFLMRSLGQVDRHGLGRQSAFIKNAQKAMVVDDVNLAHVFSLLRVEELLENLTDALPIKLCARTVLAMLGEITPLGVPSAPTIPKLPTASATSRCKGCYFQENSVWFCAT